jgi:hypothetical protein
MTQMNKINQFEKKSEISYNQIHQQSNPFNEMKQIEEINANDEINHINPDKMSMSIERSKILRNENNYFFNVAITVSVPRTR